MYLPDLSKWPGGEYGENAKAVGWLDPDNDFLTGVVTHDFFHQLFELLKNPWQSAVTVGYHPCPFCRFTGGPAQMFFAAGKIVVGTSILVVPTVSEVFVAPTLVAHYIDAHAYSPPHEFVEAVLGCPEMRSMPYLRLLRANGISSRA